MNMKPILKDALKSHELTHLLRTWLESDNTKQTLEDFTPTELIQEANWILWTINVNDNFLLEDLKSDNPDERNFARREIKALKSFIKKYEATQWHSTNSARK